MSALGWDKIVAKTPNDVLVAVLDAMVGKVGLVAAPPAAASSPSIADGGSPAQGGSRRLEPPKQEAKPEPPAAATPVPTADHAFGRAREDPLAHGATGARPSRRLGPCRGGGPSIEVAFEEDVVIADRGLPTSPRMRAASPVDEEDTEVKRLRAP